MSVLFKQSLHVFKSQLVSLCDQHKIGLEDWERQHVSVRNAEHGRFEAKAGKTGVVKLSKGAKSGRWSQGQSADYGENPHASLKFQRECDSAASYKEEFPSAVIGMTDEATVYAKGIAEKAKELATRKEPAKAGVPA